MFGKRSQFGAQTGGEPTPAAVQPRAPEPTRAPEPSAASRSAPPVERAKSEDYYQTKSTIFSALIEAIDLSQLSKLDSEAAREEIRDIVNEIIALKSIVMSISELEELLYHIANDVLGCGPREPLLARDDIADIMVNGAST